MNIHSLHEAPPPWLGEAMERFETRFRYPLGEGVSFRISHGAGYLSFFQAMGDATVWVAERDGEVCGTLAAAVRTLRLPHAEQQRAAYLCDLKVMPGGGGGRALALLAGAATSDLIAQGLRSAYAVVMGGTSRTPMRYTGRVGIPAFSAAGEIAILKIETGNAGRTTGVARVASVDEVNAVHGVLSHDCVHAEGGHPALRSLVCPVALLSDDEQACGVVEDTRRGKRLWLDNGEEIMAAHLSRFAYANSEAGVALVRDALAVVSDAGFPAMFVAVRPGHAANFAAALGDARVHVAPAKVFGHGLPMGDTWSVDTAEI